MTQEMSDAEQEYLQALVHRIATHIVEGSAAVQELKSTVARLKNERSDIEYAVYEHWLRAAKTIEAAGKEKSSWEKFIKALRMSYGEDDVNKKAELALSTSGSCHPGEIQAAEDHHLLQIASKELWAHVEMLQNNNNNVGISTTTTTDHRFVETGVVSQGSYRFEKPSDNINKLDLSETLNFSHYDTERLALEAGMTIGEPNQKAEDHHLLPVAPKEPEAFRNNVGTNTTKDHRLVETVAIDQGYRLRKQSDNIKKLDFKSERNATAYDTKKLAQAAITIGVPDYNYCKKSKGSKKRKLEDSASELVGGEVGGPKKKIFIQFTNGRKVGGEKVVALKKDGRCFYCERKGHRAAECKDNPDNQGKL